MEGGKRALVNGVSDDHGYKAEIERLQRIIGKQAIQIEILKKRRSCSANPCFATTGSQRLRLAKREGLEFMKKLSRSGRE